MNPLLIAAAVIAAGAGGVYLVRRGAGGAGGSSATGPRPIVNLRLVRRPMSLPDVPGLREREAAEPGFAKALMEVIRETKADGDKVAAYISRRSGFDPHHKGDKPSNPGGVGLWGFNGGRGSGGGAGFMSALENQTYTDIPDYFGYEPSPAEYVQGMTATEQVKGPLRALLLAHPAFGKDPAIHILAPFFGVSESLPGDPPQWDENKMATAPDSTVIIEQPYENLNPLAHATPWDEQMWPWLGHFEGGTKDGVVTLGNIRGVFYKPLQGAGRFK